MAATDAGGAADPGKSPVKTLDPGPATSTLLAAVTTAVKGTPSSTGNVAGTSTPWHTVVLWFLGAVALLALADPAPGIATALVLLIILGTLLNNWPVYKSYLGMK